MSLFPKSGSRRVDALFVAALINFLLFIIIDLVLGGDAANGHIENGHYFLASHGKLTEVSAFVFTYSLIHAYLSIALMLIAVFTFLLFRVSPRASTHDV
jgi:hypothetical protein